MFRIILLVLSLPLLLGFSFTPMSQSIDLGGKNRSAQFHIENTSAKNIAVELTVRERKMDPQGIETLPKTELLQIYPPQVLVPPGEKRAIRVNYLGKDIPEAEQSFRVIAEELPVNLEKKGKEEAGVKMLMRFVAALYATPKDAKHDLSVSLMPDTAGTSVRVENRGTKHALLMDVVLEYTSEKKKGEIKGSDLKGLVGENVLAGQTRIFKLPAKLPIPKDATLKLKVNE